jgi:succinate dehydrogenase/fumarate reductase cytochrome b subunit
MNIVLAAVIIVVVTGVAVAAMLLVRRGAPDGGYFNDGDRASGVFGVLATGFSVLLGFLIFLTFESYDASRAGAEAEARTIAEQVENAQLFPSDVREQLTGDLVCYGRFVIEDEWEKMEDGSLGDAVNPWGVELFLTVQSVDPGSSSEEAAYGKWLDQTSDREQARLDRIHGATGVIPTPLWIALFFITAIVFAYLLFFADSSERAVVQGMLMGSVAAVITSMLLLLAFLDDPFHGDVGGVRPVAMQRTLVIIDEALAAIDLQIDLPCDELGTPV